jgi:flagellar motor switch protein FliN/FliY
MLGVEEKKHNEITRDLLKKFSSELSVTIAKRMEANGMTVDLEDSQVLTSAQVEKQLSHEDYFYARMEIEGVADENVRAALLVGNPETVIVKEEEPEEEQAEAANKGGATEDAADKEVITATDPSEEEFNAVDAEEMEEMGSMETIISGRHVEFEDFEEASEIESVNGNGRSMDLLKDVEMDVSVELGRIELPLGKVLQLAKGSVIELEKLAGEPVDILVNGQCIAQGEVVVIDEHFGVRIANLVTTRQRIAKLQ